MRKFWMGTGMAIATTAAAMAQDTTDDGLLGGLLSGGVIGIVVLGVVAFFLWNWFFSGN